MLAALGAFTIIGLFLFAAVTGTMRWSTVLSERESSESELGGFADRLESEEDSAWAIFTPDAGGRELHFFMRDSRSRAHFWAYRYDAAAQTLQRLLYASPGDTMAADGPPLTGVVSFFAKTFPVTALQDPASPVYTPLYSNASLTPATVPFIVENTSIAGGNQVTYVRIATTHSIRVLALTTQTAPSGFTVVLRYTPRPSLSPAGALTAAIATSQVSGRWYDCPDRTKDCSNAEWPQYRWTQTITSQYYRSVDGGYSWSQFDSAQTANAGISGPTGGDLPSIPCDAGIQADFTRACTPDWIPAAPPGTAGMDLTP